MGAGGYIASVLLLVEVALVFLLAFGRTTKTAFTAASVAVLFAAAFFWMGDRVTELTVGGIGTIRAAADTATKYVDEIKGIRSELDRQKQEAADAVAAVKKEIAEAKLALEKFKAPRSLTLDAQQRVSEQMKSFAGVPFTIGVFDDPEAIDLMIQIDSALVAAGWQEAEWKSGGDIVLGRAPRPNFGYTLVIGLYVQADNKHISDFGPIVRALAAALTEVGVPAKPEIGRMAPDTNNDAIKILVGKKPL